MLYFIGLGLFDEKDISLKGIEILKKVDTIYAEFYTAKLFGSTFSSLEEIVESPIKILSRKEVEEDNIPINSALDNDVAFVTAGDPLIATTHSDMMIQAKKRGIDAQVVHASSILSAAPGIAGLQAYKFGKVTTIPFPEKNYFPHSPYLTIETNMKFKAHSLVLLDIRAEEERYMTANQGLDYLLNVEKERNKKIVLNDSIAVVIARAGSLKPLVRSDRIQNLLNEDFGGPLHSLIIPSQLHIMEAEYLVEVAGAPEEILKKSI
ncbi:MAG: diphthine synthase [Methanobacteriaceae archaeon]|jgi:diphthine synthase|nr:MAG: diphthine synthase [Methanobacterium sp. BRmetb2]MCC7557416.1 diphthine synthase [Methanobacteriaceae archaeon]